MRIRIKIVDIHNWETLPLPLVYKRTQFENPPRSPLIDDVFMNGPYRDTMYVAHVILNA